MQHSSPPFQLIGSGKLDRDLNTISVFDGHGFTHFMKRMDFSIFKQVYVDITRKHIDRELTRNEKLVELLQHYRDFEAERARLFSSKDVIAREDTEEMSS